MAHTLTKPKIIYGGRFLYTINQKNDGKILSFEVKKQTNANTKTVILSFSDKKDANNLASTLEFYKTADKLIEYLNIAEINKIEPIINYNLSNIQDLYVNKWDSYHLRDYLHLNNIDLIVYNDCSDLLNCSINYYNSSDNINDYVQHLNSLYNKI